MTLEQRKGEMLAQASVMAAATASGTHGTQKPLKALEEALTGRKVSASGSLGVLQDRMMKLATDGGVKIVGGKLVGAPAAGDKMAELGVKKRGRNSR